MSSLRLVTWVCCAVLLCGAGKAPRADAPEASRSKKLVPHAAQSVTRCAACHTTDGWSSVAFNHDKTGFPLRGAHPQVACKDCHPKDFDSRVPRDCAGCHRDPHGGELGLRCTGCHDETSWKTQFNADAHRRTVFPLFGRHASLPCQECHQDAAQRKFQLSPVDCVTCHLPEYQRTASTGVNHERLQFSTDCRGCHSGFTFRPARYPGHDTCFQISAGPHVGIACLGCHTSLPASTASPGTCRTGTASCTSCHQHSCDRSDAQHQNVPGYQCKDQKCYSCHRFAEAP